MNLTRRAALAATLAFPMAVRAQGKPVPGSAERPLLVGVTSGVHAQVLEQVRDAVGKQGLVLKIVEFGDFIQPNVALAAGDIDVNVYQHRPFLDQQIKDRGYDFVAVGRTVLTAMAIYSTKAKSVDALPNGARIAIPNDPTNGGRALLLLAEAGVFKLTPGADFRATIADITDNPKRVRIVELEAAQIARSLADVDAAAVTGNYAVPAGLDPLHGSLAMEKGDSVYCCLVVVRKPDADAPWAKALAAGYADPGVRQWVTDTFKGAVIPGA
ncbi:MAG: MetQ/NlpA family ABC transporter substrate-binding protein [Acetobacteraceae bacterium]|nr:MetQ/NlpA family ABC transporter substrate-binding protein [Acetobacteraceae bacterium]